MAKRCVFRSSSIHIDDAAVEEILLRLPSSKSAIRCRLVCKHWKSLISSPFFLERLKDHHLFQPCALIISCTDHHLFQPCALIIGCTEPLRTFTHHTVASINEIRQSSEFRLEFPPPFKPEFLRIATTYNDMILYHSLEYSTQEKHYLCNALTKQYVPIPPVPEDFYHYRDVRFGLMCDGSSVRVVIIRATRASLQAKIFSSDDDPCGSGINSIALGVCLGSLRLLQVSFPCVARNHNRFHNGFLRVWELDDCDRGGWSLKFEAFWKEIVKDETGWKEICDDLLNWFSSEEIDGSRDDLRNDDYDDDFSEKLNLNCVKLELKALALDPNDEEKVYFVNHQNNCVFSCI